MNRSTNNWPQRLYALDISRGIASLSVIIWHWQHFSYQNTNPQANFDRASQPLYAVLKILYEHGGKGVDFFFLLSGFIFFWLYSEPIESGIISVKKFVIARFSRLYPLHIVALVLVLILQTIYNNLESDYFVYPYNDAYHFVLNLFFASHWGLEHGHSFNAPIWSVSIEVLLYAIFFMVALTRLRNIFFCLAISLTAFYIFKNVYHHILFQGMTSFFLGGFLYHSIRIIDFKYPKFQIPIYLLCTISWLLVIINYHVYRIDDLFSNSGLYPEAISTEYTTFVLFPLTVCTIALFEIKHISVTSNGLKLLKSFSWLGDITYSSYLLHFPLQIVLGIAVSTQIIDSSFYLNPLYLILFFGILIPLSYFVFLKFEKPAQKLIRGRLLGTKTSYRD